MVKTVSIKVFTLDFLLNQIPIFEAKIILCTRTRFPGLALMIVCLGVLGTQLSHEDTIISSLAGDRYTYLDTSGFQCLSLAKMDQSENTVRKYITRSGCVVGAILSP